MSNSLWPQALQTTRLLCPWDFPGKNTGVGCHFLLQGIFQTQGWNSGLLFYRPIIYHWNTSKESNCNVGDLGLIPGLGRSPGEGKGYPFLYSGLENSMDRAVHGVAKSWTWLSNFQFTPGKPMVFVTGTLLMYQDHLQNKSPATSISFCKNPLFNNDVLNVSVSVLSILRHSHWH